MFLCLVVILDQLSKALIMSTFSSGETQQVIPELFNLVLVFNKGAAFGVLSGLGNGVRQLVLAITTASALALVLYFLFFDYRHDRYAHVGLGMIMGGAVGNLIDRFRLGQVIDFLDFYIGSWHWPAFNVADSAICFGVGLLILRSFKPKTDSSQI